MVETSFLRKAVLRAKKGFPRDRACASNKRIWQSHNFFESQRTISGRVTEAAKGREKRSNSRVVARMEKEGLKQDVGVTVGKEARRTGRNAERTITPRF